MKRYITGLVKRAKLGYQRGVIARGTRIKDDIPLNLQTLYLNRAAKTKHYKSKLPKDYKPTLKDKARGVKNALGNAVDYIFYKRTFGNGAKGKRVENKTATAALMTGGSLLGGLGAIKAWEYANRNTLPYRLNRIEKKLKKKFKRINK